jgi:UDP-N-acetylglucosamine 2-epimerase (non-hydrolysing)
MAQAINPYGDGQAAKRIVASLLYSYGFTTERPADFQPELRANLPDMN